MATRPAVGALRPAVTGLLVSGFALLVLAVVFGFEEPDQLLLGLAAVLLASAIASVFLHLAFTRTLTREQKTAWAALLLRRAPLRAWSEYLSASDLAATAARLSRKAGQP